MKLWFRIIITFIIQELVLMNTTLLHAYQAEYDLLIVTAIFLAASIFDVLVGYVIGKWVQKKYAGTRFVQSLEHNAQSFEFILGEKGYALALTILGFINFNYVNAFLASWTHVPFKKAAMYLVLGDLLWYTAALLMIMGVSSYVNPFYAMYVVMGISIIAMLSGAYVHKNMLKKSFAA